MFPEATDLADHSVGDMDITMQEKTFTGFLRLVGWAGCTALVVLIFLALVNA